MKPIHITELFVNYSIALTAGIIAVAVIFGVYRVWVAATADIPHPKHFTRTEEHDEFDRQVRIQRVTDNEVGPIIVLLISGAFVFALARGMLLGLSVEHQRIVCGSVFIATIGGGLFFLKVKALGIYALLEISFAVWYAFETLTEMQDQINRLQANVLGTATYLLIRGLDNLRTYWKSRQTNLAND